MSSLAMPRSDSRAEELPAVDEVAADLILQVLLPVELDGAGDGPPSSGRGVLVDLDEDGLVGGEVLPSPFGADQDVGACHGYVLSEDMRGLLDFGDVVWPGDWHDDMGRPTLCGCGHGCPSRVHRIRTPGRSAHPSVIERGAVADQRQQQVATTEVDRAATGEKELGALLHGDDYSSVT